MPLTSIRGRKALGTALVGLQFAGMFWLAAQAVPAAARGDIPMASWPLAVGAVALFGWILLHNRPGNFNIRPQPKVGARLVTDGPYRWIRHPMYTAVLLGGAALAPLADGWSGWATWLGLAGVLFAKALLEEAWMQEQHSGYRDYMWMSKRFIPLVF